jgi:hypothetical protein
MVQAVMRSTIKPPGVRLVAFLVAWHYNDEDGCAWPGMGTLADEAQVTRDRVKQVLRELKTQGVLEVAAKGRGRAATRLRFTAEWVGKYATGVAGFRSTALPPNDETEPASEGKPTTGVAGFRGSTDPLSREAQTPSVGKHRPTRKDERKTESSLSSKDARTTSSGQPAKGRQSAQAAAVAAPAAKPNSQQPLTRERFVLPAVRAWMQSPESIEAKGVELGLGSFNEAAEPPGQGVPWARYVIRVMRAAGVVLASDALGARA